MEKLRINNQWDSTHGSIMEKLEINSQWDFTHGSIEEKIRIINPYLAQDD